MPWKKIIAVTAILLAVVLLAVFWWVSRFDFNRLKPIITQQVRSAIAREITIEGDIRLKIGLAPTLIAGPVKLRNADWGSRPDMLTVDEVELQIGLLALLSKKIVFKRLVLVKPDVWVEQNADGTKSNWEFDTPPAKDAALLQGPPRTRLNWHWRMAKIQDGQLHLVNHHTGESTNLHIGNFVLEKESGPLPLKTALKGGYNEKAFSLEGGISFFMDLFITSKDWAFDLAIKDAQSEVTLAGRLQRPSGDAPHRLEATHERPSDWMSALGCQTLRKAAANVEKTNRVFPDYPPAV